jgi:type I restriction enzyme S subunit
LRSANFRNNGSIDYSDIAYRKIEENRLNKRRVANGTILIEKSGGSPTQAAGRVVYCDRDFNGTASNFIEVVTVRDSFCPQYIAYLLYYLYQTGLVLKYQQQTTGIINFKLYEYYEEVVSYATSKLEQAKIAEILSAVDLAIEQTEALIAKQQRIKTGLMQDLLTRGIDEHGDVRSEQTHKFKDSRIGRIPAEWEVTEFGCAVASAVDGPFGSNLKTEHYVEEPGVRVIRLGNIGNGEFLDSNKAYISNEHAKRLARHSAEYGDLLVASLGDERHPFGRACLYTDNIHAAIVKADVFRIRCRSEKYTHSFAVHLFNFPRWRRELFPLAQGVTRDRVNLTNLIRLQLPMPLVEEQKTIDTMIEAANSALRSLNTQLTKITALKTALMQDLLSGEKRVTTLLELKPKRERVYAAG